MFFEFRLEIAKKQEDFAEIRLLISNQCKFLNKQLKRVRRLREGVQEASKYKHTNIF